MQAFYGKHFSLGFSNRRNTYCFSFAAVEAASQPALKHKFSLAIHVNMKALFALQLMSGVNRSHAGDVIASPRFMWFLISCSLSLNDALCLMENQICSGSPNALELTPAIRSMSRYLQVSYFCHSEHLRQTTHKPMDKGQGLNMPGLCSRPQICPCMT